MLKKVTDTLCALLEKKRRLKPAATLLFTLCLAAPGAFAAPDVPEITGPELSTQPPAYTVAWTDESGSGATSYVVKRTPSGAAEHTVTANGGAHITGPAWGERKFGTGSHYFNGTSGYLSYDDSDGWDVVASTADSWTIDLWCKVDLTSKPAEFAFHGADGNNAWYFCHGQYSGLCFTVIYNGSYECSIYDPDPNKLKDGQWHHVAMCKVESAIGLYVDGVQVAYGVLSQARNFSASLLVGQEITGLYKTTGYFDEVRIQHSNYFGAAPDAGKTNTIDVPTAPSTTNESTKLLEHFDSVKPFGTETCVFDGIDDNISIPDSSDWDIAGSTTDNWTIDLWVKHVDHYSYEGYVSQFSSGSNRWELYHRDGYGIVMHVVQSGNTVEYISSGGEIMDTNWHHIAVCKVGNVWGTYKDGEQVGYAVQSVGATNEGFLYIGGHTASGSFMDGYLDDVRIQKSNVFNANPNSEKTNTIVVPIAPHQPDENTKLYLSFDGYIQDESRSILTTTTSNELAESNMEDGTYDYRVRAVDADSYSSAYSDALTLTVDSSIPVLALNSVTPTKNRWYEDDTATYSVDAIGSNVEYQFKIGETVLQDYSSTSSAQYTPGAGNVGRKTRTVNVVDDYNETPKTSAQDLYVYRRPIGA